MKEPSMEGTPFSALSVRNLKWIINHPIGPVDEGSNDGVPLEVADYVGRRYASILLREKTS